MKIQDVADFDVFIFEGHAYDNRFVRIGEYFYLVRNKVLRHQVDMFLDDKVKVVGTITSFNWEKYDK